VPESQTCSYGSCCPDAYQCVNGAWQSIALPCPGPAACPPEPPVSGDTCDSCFQGPCSYVCPDGQTSVVATCQDLGTWALGNCPTPPPVVCGNTTCNSGEVCVQKEGGPGFSYACAPNPCGSQPLSCGCAQDLCGGAPETCTSTMGAVVYCSCPTCA
jgi:hypothetical protein